LAATAAPIHTVADTVNNLKHTRLIHMALKLVLVVVMVSKHQDTVELIHMELV
jgi:hypothetical protein